MFSRVQVFGLAFFFWESFVVKILPFTDISARALFGGYDVSTVNPIDAWNCDLAERNYDVGM